MNIRNKICGLSAIIGLYTATFSGLSQAGDISTGQPLICATVGVVACMDDSPCQQGLAQTYDVPTFIYFDFEKKIVHTQGEKEGDASSPINTTETTKQSIILQGIEEHRGWTAVINRNSGRMTLSSTGPEVNFMLTGNCTTRPQ